MLSLHDSSLTAQVPAPLQEAAVLFAAGHAEAACGVLHAQLLAHGDELEPAVWIAFLEACAAVGHAELRRQWSTRFVARFGFEAPDVAAPAAPIVAPGCVALEGTLADPCPAIAAIPLKGAGKAVCLDFSRVDRIDFQALPMLSAELRRLGLAGRRVVIANVSALQAALLDVAGIARSAVLIRRAAMPESLAA